MKKNKRNKKTIEKCLIDGCGIAVMARGVCWRHWQLMQNSVKSGQRTWQEFEDVGMAKSKQFKGRAREQFENALKEKFQ